MQRQRERPRKHAIQHVRLLQFLVINEDVVQALRDFQLRRKNEKREKKLDARAVFDLKIGRRDFDEAPRLPRPRLRRDVKRVFHAADHEQSKIVVRVRFVTRMKRHFDKNARKTARQGLRVRALQRVPQVVLAETERRQKTDVEIIADFQIRDDAEVEAWSADRFDAGERVVADKIFGVKNAVIGFVVAECDAKIIGL